MLCTRHTWPTLHYFTMNSELPGEYNKAITARTRRSIKYIHTLNTSDIKRPTYKHTIHYFYKVVHTGHYNYTSKMYVYITTI